MKTFSLIAAFAVSLTAALPASDCHAQWPGTTRGTHHKHSLEIGGRAYSRPGTDLNIPLITDAETAETLFDASQATNGGSAPGVELKYGFEGPMDRQLEIRTIIAEFQTDTTVTAPGTGFASPLFPADGIQGFNYGYDSRLMSFELNACRSLAPGVQFSFGPRYVSLKDTVTTTLDGLSPSIVGSPQQALKTVATREATNGLMGFQAGLDIKLPIAQQIYTTGFIRTGGYYNPTEVSGSQDSFLAGSLIDSVPSAQQSKSTGSFLAEVGGRVYVDLYEDAISAYAGYEATWIDGIALAPTAFFSDSTAGVETANTLFFHAVTFGIRMNF